MPSVCFDVSNFENNPYLVLSYSESSFFAGKIPDATGDIVPLDLPIKIPIRKNGETCVPDGFLRGAFKYLTIYIPETGVPADNSDFYYPPKDKRSLATKEAPLSWYDLLGRGIKSLVRAVGDDTDPSVTIKAIWVKCTSFPSQSNGRAYSGYFDSSSSLLNRIWYAGAYTLQLETIKPNEACSIIQFSSEFDGTHPVPGAWYSNYTISNGSVVLGEGAKRDRMVWPGDMGISIPGIAVSTYDMLAPRNALDSLYNLQYSDGGIPYAGIPMGQRHEFSDTYHMHGLIATHTYVLYTGDIPWIKAKWQAYKRAVDLSINKIDDRNLMAVTSNFDWIRPGMEGHNVEASAIALQMIEKSIELAEWVGEKDPSTGGVKWTDTYSRLRSGFSALYCPGDNLFGDNLESRGCNGPQKVLPQDGNSFVLLSKATDPDTSLKVSQALRNRWTKFGAPAVEFPNVISPFASGMELQGHVVAGNHDAAVELMELEWGYMMDGPGMTNSTLIEGVRMDGYIHYPAYASPPRNSHAHGWSTGPTSVLLHGILGIKLVTPMGKTWEIEPHLTKWLSRAQGGFATKLGKFEVSTSRLVALSDGRKAQGLNVTVPRGTSGTIKWFGQENKVGEEATNNIQVFSFVIYTGNDKQAATVTAVKKESVWKNFAHDAEWVKPATEERPVGVVDFSVLHEHYVSRRGEKSKRMLRDEARLAKEEAAKDLRKRRKGAIRGVAV